MDPQALLISARSFRHAHLEIQQERATPMTHRQHPLGTGFPPSATADDVLAGIDLTGTNVIITGGHSGLGLESTRALTKAGASVTVAARSVDRAAVALAGLEKVEIGQLDLIDPESIDAFTNRWLDTGRPLHVLINNAGLPSPGQLTSDPRGYEVQFATSHLGHFQLTLGLHSALRAAEGARVVNLSSGAQRFFDIQWNDPHFKETYDANASYGQAKTAGVLFAVEMDRRWEKDRIRAFAVHPGVVVGTGMNRASGPGPLAMGLVDSDGNSIIDPERGKKNPQQGASTIVFAAASSLLNGRGGLYLKDNDISPLDDEFRPMSAESIPAYVVSHSIDPRSARRLWDLSEYLLA
jgi:NAD(P)-dependent dehydrogenase (short-subunit alcohol dehydrogenase family)